MSYTDSVKDTLMILNAASSTGIDTNLLLEEANIDPASLTDLEARIASEKNSQLLQAAINHSGDPAFAVHIGEWVNHIPANLFYTLVCSCATLLEAVQFAARYFHLQTDAATLSILEDGDTVYVTFQRENFPNTDSRHYVEFIFSTWMKSVRLNVSEEHNPREVHFVADWPQVITAYESYFNCPVLFGQSENCIIWNRELMEYPCASYNPSLNVVLERYAQTRLAKLSKKDAFIYDVQRAIANSLYQDTFSLDAIAEQLNIAPRTLQYRLKQKGQSYKELLDQVRKELAFSYLADPDVTIRESALALGFSEVKSFYRAFHRWAGKTPAEYRRDLLGKPARETEKSDLLPSMRL